MDDLTQQQRQILAAIKRRAERGEAPPTYRDLCAEFGWASTGTARDHLQALARKGHVELGEGRARRLRLTEQLPPPAVNIRVLGEVAAGTPVGVEEVDLGVVPAPPEWGPPAKLFALKVAGESMRDCGILDGDVVVVRRQPSADDGEIVVATLAGETTLKRLSIQRSGTYLLPENPDFSPIAVGEDGVSIHGVVVGLMRGLARQRPRAAQRSVRRPSGSRPARPDSVMEKR